MVNRKIAPEIKEISNLVLPDPAVFKLDNGIPVYQVNMGTQDVMKLELVFKAGRPFESKKLVGRATARMLKEGTNTYNSAQIAEIFDFYGSSLNTPINLDTATINCYCLSKHFDKLIPVIADVLTNPVFPQEELAAYIKNSKQKLQVDLSKNDVIAYRKITEFIFGKEHIYGYNSVHETYDALRREDLIKHFQEAYVTKNCQIFISGKMPSNIISLLNQHLGNSIPIGKAKEIIIPDYTPTPEKVKITNSNTIQTAIRIGRRMFNRSHKDFIGMYILDAVLGGYFGSRLMANIREDKGYTYNIFSTIDPMLFDGCFYIGTEVGNEFVEATLREVYKELEILQTELIKKDELTMVKNYLLGNLLTTLDGPFNISDMTRTLYTNNLDKSYFYDLVKMIKSITPEQLRQLAQKYLKKEDMWEVVVGV